MKVHFHFKVSQKKKQNLLIKDQNKELFLNQIPKYFHQNIAQENKLLDKNKLHQRMKKKNWIKEKGQKSCIF